MSSRCLVLVFEWDIIVESVRLDLALKFAIILILYIPFPRTPLVPLYYHIQYFWKSNHRGYRVGHELV